MYSKFPVSMESIARSSGFLCLSLKFGCIITALVYIVYSTLGLAVCVATLADLDNSPERLFTLTSIALDSISHGVSFVLSFILLLGLLKDRASHIRPWIMWTSIQTLAYASLFVVSTGIQLMKHADTSLAVYVVQLAVLALRVYMLILIVSFYKELQESQKVEQLLQELTIKGTWYTDA